MTNEVFSLLLDQQTSKLNGKAVGSRLDQLISELSGKAVGSRVEQHNTELNGKAVENRTSALSDKAVESRLSRVERIEVNALRTHQDKTPAVAHRIRILACNMAQPNRFRALLLRFYKKFKQNLAELEALVHYGDSKAVWEIAYLYRKKATQRLLPMEKSELNYLILFHDSPEVLRITNLKLREEYGALSPVERQELVALQRNLYQDEGIPNQLLEMLWPSQKSLHLDVNCFR